MRLGIDFGTTRTVVAAADRGNYPVISFQGPDGDSRTWYPSVVAARPGERLWFGLDAEARFGEPGWSFLKSFKRSLASNAADASIQLAGASLSTLELLTQFLKQLKTDLLERSNLELAGDEPLEAFIAVPANSNSNQRFITLESFVRAGFRVLGMMNEPSAGGIEFAHFYGGKHSSRKFLVVYDLGGGTFDASVITVKGENFDVLANEGIARLGGDDFDQILKELTLARAGLSGIDSRTEFDLLEACRTAKENLNPNSRRISIDLEPLIPGIGQVVIPVAEFYGRCQPLVEKTIEAVELATTRGLGNFEDPWSEVTALYLVGGSSDLPIVARTLRDRYGRRVRRSPYPYAATAIGLAIAVDRVNSQQLQERFSRYFGVWREADYGRAVTFDPIFARETPLPHDGQPDLISTRRYRPVHNLGYFRYLECSRLDSEGRPAGDITPWDTVTFPFDPGLQKHPIDDVEVQREPAVEEHVVEEHYRCDPVGIIEVTIADRTTGFSKSYRLRRNG